MTSSSPNRPASSIVTLSQNEQYAPPWSPWKRALYSMAKGRWPMLALIVLILIIIVAIFGPQFAPRDPNRQTLVAKFRAPLQQDRQGVIQYALGTDQLGRDVLSRLIYGARISLSVGITAVLIGGTFGVTVGLVAGYFGGRVDDFIMWIAEIQLAFPFILLAIMVLVVLGPSVPNLIITLGIGQWETYALIARAQTKSQKEKEYIEAARAIGGRQLHIMLTGILPNIISPLIVIASFNVAGVILSEASLSFLGLGVPPSVPTWGAMLADSRDSLIGGVWWLAVLPGIAIMLTVLSLNILGDWLRDFLDPRLRGKGGGL